MKTRCLNMPELIVYIGYKIVSATIQKHQTCFFPHCFTWFYWDIVGWHFPSFIYQKNCRIERKKGGKNRVLNLLSETLYFVDFNNPRTKNFKKKNECVTSDRLSFPPGILAIRNLCRDEDNGFTHPPGFHPHAVSYLPNPFIRHYSTHDPPGD